MPRSQALVTVYVGEDNLVDASAGSIRMGPDKIGPSRFAKQTAESK